jgi:hypothetical protein
LNQRVIEQGDHSTALEAPARRNGLRSTVHVVAAILGAGVSAAALAERARAHGPGPTHACAVTRYYGCVGGRSVRVFHVSDLHMRSVEGPQRERARREAAFRWRVLGQKWRDNLVDLRKDGVPFDLVVFTGDLADWGHPTDYAGGVAFLKETCEALGVPIERLFVVPGNHDIDRKIQPRAWAWLRKHVGDDPPMYSEWLAGDEPHALRRSNRRRDQVLERQQAFWGAVATQLGRPELLPSQSPHRRLGFRQTLTLPGLQQPVHVIGLDTSWLAGDERDAGALRLTDHQVALLTTTEGGAPLPGLRLALMHHRFADLADATAARQGLADRVDLVLHGHQHEATADLLQGPDHKLLVLAAGCLYEGDGMPSRWRRQRSASGCPPRQTP